MIKWLLILPLGFLVLVSSACGYRQQQQVIVMPQYQYTQPPTYIIQNPAPQPHYIAPRPLPYPVPYPVPHPRPPTPFPPYR